MTGESKTPPTEVAPCRYKVAIAAAEGLQETLMTLDTQNYRVRQIYQEPAASVPRYVIFAEDRRCEQGEQKNERPKSKRRRS